MAELKPRLHDWQIMLFSEKNLGKTQPVCTRLMQETSTGIGETNFCQRFLKDLKIYFAILTLDIELIQFQ